MNLTIDQQNAVNHLIGPAIVIAGPGAGKTFVLTERVKKLIEVHKVPANEMLVTTFTDKAATELKVRLARTVGRAAQLMHISTVHSFCKDLLEKYFIYHNYGSEINVIDDISQRIILDINKSKFGLVHWDTTKRKYVKVKKSFDFFKDVRAFFDLLTRNMVDPDELLAELRTRNELLEEDEKIINAYKGYLEFLEKEKKMDFAMLQARFFQLITNNPDVLEEIHRRFKYIMVDEYQDTSPLQDRIFRLLAGQEANLFVGGDANQSIYGFRGANIWNFKGFKEKLPQAREYLLNVNFRSTEEIVDLANEIFRIGKDDLLQKHRNAGGKIHHIHEKDVDASAEEAIKFLKQLKELNIIGKYGDVAFLFRSLTGHSQEFIKYLEKEDIPYTTSGDGRFLEREEITTIIGLMVYVSQPALGNGPQWWKKTDFLNSVLNLSATSREVLQNSDFVLSELQTVEAFNQAGFTNQRDIQVLQNLNQLRSELTKEKESADLAASKYSLLVVFYKILEYSGYLSRILQENTRTSREKMQNLGFLSQLIYKYLEIKKKDDIKGFFQYLNYSSEKYDQLKLEDEDSVKLMTVHKAKGLEFPVVFLCCLNEGRFPLRFKDNIFIPVPEKFLQLEGKNTSEDEFFNEEKRLFYVGLTRTQDLLVLTSSDKITTNRSQKSRFLGLIPDNLFYTEEIKQKIESSYRVSKEVPILNYSAINTFVECPFLYNLNIIYGFNTPFSFMQTLGSFVHNTVQSIHEFFKSGTEVGLEEIEKLVNRYWVDLPISKKRNQDMMKSYIKQFMEYVKNVRPHFKQILSIEESFSFIDDNMIIKGKTDLIVKDETGHICLIDFKTRAKTGIEKTGTGMQLQIYDYCLDHKYDIDRLYAYTFYDHEMVPFEKDKKDVRKYLEEISQKMLKEDFDKRKCSLCSDCHIGFCC